MKKLEKEYQDKKCWGLVSSVDVYNCDPSFISNAARIRRFIIDLCKEIDMKRHGPALVERFAEGELEGYSALQFIETSSITMHFDEGKNRAFIDIFSCKFFDHKKAEKFCKNYLKGNRSKSVYYLRY